jgi:hypothetical protein
MLGTILFIAGIIVGGAGGVLMYKYYTKKEVISEELEEHKNKLYGSSPFIINYAEVNGNVIYRSSEVEGLGLDGNTIVKGFPRDIVTDEQGNPIQGDPDKFTQILVQKGFIVGGLNPRRSPLPIYFLLPYHPDELDDGDPIAPVFKAYVALRKVANNTVELLKQSVSSQAELMRRVNSREISNYAFQQYQSMMESTMKGMIQHEVKTDQGVER